MLPVVFCLDFMYQQTDDKYKVFLTERAERGITRRQAAREKKAKLEIAKSISSCNPDLSVESVISYATTIYEESIKYNIDSKLILAIIQAESEFNFRARSHKGAIGLMQLRPNTAKWVSSNLGLRYRGLESLYDPDYNIKMGIHYLDMMRRKYRSLEEALAAYNRGPAGLERYVEEENELPKKYVERVMGYYKELKG